MGRLRIGTTQMQSKDSDGQGGPKPFDRLGGSCSFQRFATWLMDKMRRRIGSVVPRVTVGTLRGDPYLLEWERL